MFKRKILIDLDGVLNIYNGKYDENYIPPIRKEVVEFLKMVSQNFIVKIFTTRDKILAQNWVKEYCIEEYISGITNTKEPAFLIIDDRAINFNGNFEDLHKQITNFKPWYKR